MNNVERTERLEQATVRIDNMIWLPGALAAGSMPDNLGEAIETLYNADSKQIVGKLPKMQQLLSGEDEPDEDWISEVLYQETGFLVQLARPVPSGFCGTSHSFSWGHYATKWIYVDDLDELVVLAEEFSEQVLERARAKEQAVTA